MFVFRRLLHCLCEAITRNMLLARERDTLDLFQSMTTRTAEQYGTLHPNDYE